jgi:hypothetical protein
LLGDVKTIRVRFVRLQSRGTALDRRNAAIVSPLASLARNVGAVVTIARCAQTVYF